MNINNFIEKIMIIPRIDRIKYLAEHKLSFKKDISINKLLIGLMINKPLSGFGKMMLGESLNKKRKKIKALKLIKNGWISADLT